MGVHVSRGRYRSLGRSKALWDFGICHWAVDLEEKMPAGRKADVILFQVFREFTRSRGTWHNETFSPSHESVGEGEEVRVPCEC